MRIVYFDLDCVRADHLGVYGYQRNTSPVIDRLAREALVLDNCFVSDAPCLPSRAALFSGRPGILNGVISHEWPGTLFRFPGQPGMPRYDEDYTMPMRLLQQRGYHTVTFSNFAQRHMAWWFHAGFSEVLNPTQPVTAERAESVNPRVIRWLRDHVRRHDKLFVHVHYWDAHTPYHPDETCRARVAQEPLPAFPDEETIRHHFKHVYGPKTARDIMIRFRDRGYTSPTPYMPDQITGRDDFKHMLDSYDGAIATADQAIGEIIRVLQDEGVYDDTAIIVSADHGEAIGQFGMYFEHGVAVDGVAHVPLIIRWPGLTDRGKRFGGMVYQYDLMATLMAWLAIPAPAMWEATSFAGCLEDADFEGHPYVVYGNGIFSLQRAVRTKDYALVRTFHPGCYPLEEVYLFDLNSDPNQQKDLKDALPDVLARMEKLYADWWHGWCTGPAAVSDPLHAQIADFEYFPVEDMLERLRVLGRHDQLEDLTRRLATRRRRTEMPVMQRSRY